MSSKQSASRAESSSAPSAGDATPPAGGSPSSATGRWALAAVSVGGAAAIGVAALLNPATIAAGPDICPFRLLTGLPCPGCGLTRSWVALAHGDLPASVSFNLFGPVFMAALAVVTVVAMWALATRRSSFPARLRPALAGRIALAVLSVWLVYGIARAIDAGVGGGVFPLVT